MLYMSVSVGVNKV